MVLNIMTYLSLKRLSKYVGFTLAVFALVLAYIYIAGHVLHMQCGLYEATGLYCPTCGATRMFIAIMRFDFKSAMGYNLFVFFSILILALLYIAQGYMYVRYNKLLPKLEWIIISYFILLFIFGIVRNVVFRDILCPH